MQINAIKLINCNKSYSKSPSSSSSLSSVKSGKVECLTNLAQTSFWPISDKNGHKLDKIWFYLDSRDFTSRYHARVCFAEEKVHSFL